MRSTSPPSTGSTKKVSCIWRAGWSLPRLSASKFIHSDSTSGPSTTSQPIPTNASISRSERQLQRVPGSAGTATDRSRDVDGLLEQHPRIALLPPARPDERPGRDRARPGPHRPACRPRPWRSAVARRSRGGPARPHPCRRGRSRAALSSSSDVAAAKAATAPRRRRVPGRPGRARRPRQGRTACWVLTSLSSSWSGRAESRAQGQSPTVAVGFRAIGGGGALEAAQARCSGAPEGSRNRKSAPPVAARPTVMCPPWAWTRPRTMYRPRPVLPRRLPCQNRLKISGRWSSAHPVALVGHRDQEVGVGAAAR